MKTSIPLVVAALAALAGCQSKNESAKSEHGAHPAPAASGQQSGSVGSGSDVAHSPAPASATEPGATSANANASKPVLDGTSPPASGDQRWNQVPSIDTDENASKSSSASSSDIGTPTTPAPGSSDKTSDQRGQVLTNEGAVTPSGASGSSSGVNPSMNDAATKAAVDSLHIDHPDSVVSRPPLGDQATLGDSQSDRMLVQRIRQAVIDDETLSPQARSVQIQSVDGQIVLKGQVGSERERQRLGDTAFRESGGKMVINQLDVISEK
jgi:osmotically-inducible protein OsmY